MLASEQQQSSRVIVRLTTEEEDRERDSKSIGSVYCPPEYLNVPDDLEIFCYLVVGDCMKLAGIQNNDVVFLTKREPKDGDIVAAKLDGNRMIKRYVVEQGCPRLRAADAKVGEFIPQHELVIEGVVVGLIRMFDRIPASSCKADG